MRNNQPVTQIEHKMKADDILVSRTDLKGHIVYANKAFCDIAGFTAEELKGKAHNLVRHPDMPAAAFQDLWDTIVLQKPWTGLVKNRCKNGDYYWVIANVSPEYDAAGHHSGFISVRTAPTQAETDAAEQLYRDVNAGKATLPSSIKCSWIKSLKLKSVMLMAAAVSLITLFAVGGMFVKSLMQEKENIELRVAAVPFITSVRQVLEFVPQHRGMGNAYLRGNKALAAKLTANGQKVDGLFKSLADTAKSAPFAQLQEDVSGLQRQWSGVKSQWERGTANESFRLHTAVIDRLLLLATNVLHEGKLTTDASPAIAHLAELMAKEVPTLNEYMGRLRGLGSGVAAAGTITDEQRDTLLELYVLAKLQRNQLLAEIDQVVSKYDPSLRAPLSQQMLTLSSNTDKYFKLVKHDLLDAAQVSIGSDRYFEAGTQAISASLSLYDAMDQSLVQLLNTEMRAVSNTYYIILLLITFGVLGALLLSLLMMQKTLKPLQEIVDGMQRIVEGDYRTMPVKHAFDELGEITDDMKTMQSILQYEIFEGKNMAIQRQQEQQQAAVDKADSETALADAFEANVGSLISGLATETEEVSSAAKEMDDISDALASQSEAAMQGVDLGSSHVNSTAAAIEEMSVTIADVSRQVSDTQGVSAQAVEEANAATKMMQELTRVANEIGSIVGTISEIAEQTNLLALNASIEAARAGDAGRGFSVVAGEVKELANQTSRATSQIREQVEGIQSESQNATTAINNISSTIDDINSFTTRVAEAMQQQAQAGREISDAAQQADMSMGEARMAVSELVGSAEGVDKSSDDMIAVAVSMSKRTVDVQKGIHSFLETLRKR
ncbi:MAG: methyl-accepting chemotaxis protein [Mariprofundus sp.]|nr:methyl-accepting chemotaxis protein [Mariprofundus sp.]